MLPVKGKLYIVTDANGFLDGKCKGCIVRCTSVHEGSYYADGIPINVCPYDKTNYSCNIWACNCKYEEYIPLTKYLKNLRKKYASKR